MKIMTKFLAVLFACTMAMSAQAKYPDAPIKLVVPFPPGGNIDATARIVAEGLTKTLGVSVVVENRPGASGIVGAEFVAHAKPDGYTCVLGSTGALATAKVMHPDMTLRPDRDFVAASAISRAPLVMVVNPKLPIHSVAELIAYGKAHPGKLSVASPGMGTAADLTAYMFEAQTGIKFLHVPFQGSAPALTSMLGGYVDVIFDQWASAGPLIQAGKLRPLAVTTLARSSVDPALPTLSETDMKGFESSTTTGLLFPAGTPKYVIQTIEAAMRKVLVSPTVKKQFQVLGADVVDANENFGSILSSEMVKWQDVAKRANVHPS